MRRSRRHRRGIEYRSAILAADEVTRLDGVPVTTVPRTILDLAAVLGRRQLERALNEAEVLRLTDPLSLEDLVARYPRRRGMASLKAILATGRIGSTVTRSELEHRFLAFLEQVGLPRPEVNSSLRIGDRWIEADCLWRAQRLIVELDGHAVHSTGRAFERDRARDRALLVAGWRVVRVTWAQLHDESETIAADLRRLLNAA